MLIDKPHNFILFGPFSIFGQDEKMNLSMFILILLNFIAIIIMSGILAEDIHNPFDQQLPDCRKGYTSIVKKTKAKAILCPMFR